MENADLDIVIEKGRILREKFITKTIQDNAQNGIETDEEQLRSRINITILGEMDFELDGKTVKKAVFAIKVDGQEVKKVYDEDFNFLGAKLESNKDIILSDTLSSMPDEKQAQIKGKLNSMDGDKPLEEAEQEHKENQEEKQQKIEEELSENMGDPALKISSYRRIVDNVFPQEFPETCEGAKEIGMACLENGSFMLVADYGNGFEMAKGTEPARPTSEQVYDIDRDQQTVEQKSPYALMRVSGNGNNADRKEIAVTFGAYGYIETKVVDRAPDNTRVARDVRENGEGTNEEKTLLEQKIEARYGVDSAQNIADLVSGKENNENDQMKQQIVEDVLQSHQEELESLYGEETEQEAAVRRYIEDAVTNKGIIVPEDIQRFVEGNIEADYGTFFRNHTQH